MFSYFFEKYYCKCETDEIGPGENSTRVRRPSSGPILADDDDGENVVKSRSFWVFIKEK